MRPSPHARFSALATLCALAFGACAPRGPARDEILWDTWGVPHVYGTTDEAVFRGQGWAQMAEHGDLLLRLYGQARGRAAEYWGERFLDSDRWVRTMGIPARGEAWLEMQTPAFRRDLEAFAEGINAYAAAHPEALDDAMERVLPVTAADVLAHGNRVIDFTFVTNEGVVRQARQALAGERASGGGAGSAASAGSNAWAISPGHSADGHALLVANPHLPWADLFLFWESQLVGPSTDVYGATLVGVPGVAIGFNDHLGWTHTVNTYDGADLFEVEKQGDGYRYGDEVRAFDTHREVIRVRAGDGSLSDDTLTVRATVHGPVVAEDDAHAVSLRVAGLDRASALKEWWDMGRATSLEEFEGALRELQIPMFNVLYADENGHILYLFNGVVPRRSAGDVATWRGVVDGSDPTTLWTDYLGYDELPRLEDPTVGWLQNANDPPWTSTIPQTLDPRAFPPYLSPDFMAFRPQRSATMLLADSSITFDELLAYKHSTRMGAADRLLDDLLPAARASGDADARRGAEVLAGWDRTADADSRGGVLFEAWLDRFAQEGGGWATPWSARTPVGTPDGLADAAAAVRLLAVVTREVTSRYGAPDVRWGDLHHAKVGEHEVEASGATGDPDGVFRVANYRQDEEGRSWVAAGDSYYCLLDFGPGGPTARVLLAYGNASQAGSPHVGDQLELYGKKEMRTPWRTRAEIEAHLESRMDTPSREGAR